MTNKILTNSDIENNRIYRRNMNKYSVEGWILAMVLMLLLTCLIVGSVQTMNSFKPSAGAIMSQQADMLERCDAIESQLIKVSEAVEAMPVIIYDETIQPLADPVQAAETQPLTAAVTETAPVWMTFTVTAYCPCVKCCGKTNGITASGTKAAEGRTVGADWSVLPAGTVIEIEGIGIRTVEDRGGEIKGNKLDLFFTSHQDALNFGRQKLRVRVIG